MSPTTIASRLWVLSWFLNELGKRGILQRVSATSLLLDVMRGLPDLLNYVTSLVWGTCLKPATYNAVIPRLSINVSS